MLAAHTQAPTSGTRSEFVDRFGSELLLPGFYLAPQGVSLAGPQALGKCRCLHRGSLMSLSLQVVDSS